MFPVVVELADRTDLGKFRGLSRSEGEWEKRQHETKSPAGPPRFGASWRNQDDQPGVEVKAIGYNTPAHRAGLRVGDTILKIGDEEISDQHQFHSLVLQSESETKLLVTRTGAEEPITIELKLNGPPVRVGISWRHTDAEPGVMMLVGVVPASPGARAGLEVLDRIIEVNGKAISDSDEFQRLMKTLPGRVELLIERNGRMSKIELELPAESDNESA